MESTKAYTSGELSLFQLPCMLLTVSFLFRKRRGVQQAGSLALLRRTQEHEQTEAQGQSHEAQTLGK